MTPCIYCGRPAQCRDHIVPQRDGGGNEPSNIAPACNRCNREKGCLRVADYLRGYPEVLARVRAYQASAPPTTAPAIIISFVPRVRTHKPGGEPPAKPTEAA
jgi:HNH endonuclease